MEKRNAKMWMALMCLVFIFVDRIESLSVTVQDVECLYEYVLYEGDTVSGNFVVVDHDIFWSSDHPGIDFTVSRISIPEFRFSVQFWFFFFLSYDYLCPVHHLLNYDLSSYWGVCILLWWGKKMVFFFF